MLHIQPVVLALLAVALGTAGCGKSSSGSSTAAATTATPTTATAATTATIAVTPVKVATGTPLSRARFIAAGDAICRRLNKQLGTASVSTKSEFNRQLPLVIGYHHTAIVDMSKLVPPPALAKDWSQILADLQAFEQDSRTAYHLIQAKNIAAVHPYVENATRSKEAMRKIAAGDGFKSCPVEEDAFD